MSAQTSVRPTSISKPPVPTKFSLVVGLDFTDADGPAFDQAARIAMHVRGSEIHLVHVFDTVPSPEKSRELVDHLRLYVNEKAAVRQGLPGIGLGIHLRGGKTVRELIQLATEVHADIIVVGSHKGPHIEDWVLGSTVERLVSGASFPVLVASPKPEEPEEHEPVIEPLCTDCVQARAWSGSKSWWCERHERAAHVAHTFSYRRELPFAAHDSEVIPTGISF
jgi:nucleotide-binding universal stress UspA family protein